MTENCNAQLDSIQYSPLIVVNGVPLYIPERVTEKSNEKILSLLNEESIKQITIIDKLSEQWFFCKPFAGVILLIVDKRTDKKLFKLKLE